MPSLLITHEKVGVINNLGHSLWEQIVSTINDTKVTENSNDYAYKAMLEILLIYDDAEEKGALRLSCFNPIAYGILRLSQLRGWDFYPTPQRTMLKLFD